MTTTQYVGARYVPLFSDPIDWDITKEYEPLTIVYTAGNSYTSRQSVPSGIDITNESYWALTGNYNAQIEQYRKETQAVATQLDTVKTTADNALSLAQTNEQDISTLDSEMAGTADSGLKTLINNETTRASDKEDSLNASITAEVTRATERENTIESEVQANAKAIAAETTARETADTALKNEIDTDIKSQIAAETTAREAADTALKNEIETDIKAKFPIGTSDIADGAVTAPKLASTALNAIWQGLEIKRFDIEDSSADNTGMSASSSVKQFHGFYIPALTMLVIERYVTENSSSDSGLVVLPSYIPTPIVSGSFRVLALADIYNSGNDYIGWTGIAFDFNGHLRLSSVQSNNTANMAPIVTYMAPYTSATSATSAAAYIDESGVIDNA